MPISDFSHLSHKGIISAFSVFNYCSQAEGINKSQQLLFTPGVNSPCQQQIVSYEAIYGICTETCSKLSIPTNKEVRREVRFEKAWSTIVIMSINVFSLVTVFNYRRGKHVIDIDLDQGQNFCFVSKVEFADTFLHCFIIPATSEESTL